MLQLIGRALCVGFVLAALSANAVAQDSVVGRIWEITVFDRASVITTQKFRATPDGKLYAISGEQTGTYVEEGNEVSLTISLKRHPYTGPQKLVRLGKNPPTWQGVWRHRDGAKHRVMLKLLQD